MLNNNTDTEIDNNTDTEIDNNTDTENNNNTDIENNNNTDIENNNNTDIEIENNNTDKIDKIDNFKFAEFKFRSDSEIMLDIMNNTTDADVIQRRIRLEVMLEARRRNLKIQFSIVPIIVILMVVSISIAIYT